MTVLRFVFVVAVALLKKNYSMFVAFLFDYLELMVGNLNTGTAVCRKNDESLIKSSTCCRGSYL